MMETGSGKRCRAYPQTPTPSGSGTLSDRGTPGGRRSANARTPSRKSSLDAHSSCAVTSCSSVSASAGSADASMMPFARPTGSGAHVSSSPTSRSVAASSSSSGATRLASPIRSASVPSTNFEHMMSSFARPSPTIAGSREQPPRSGSRPTRVSTRPMTASSATTRRSHASASSAAPPRQAPWICAIVGFAIRSQRLQIARICSRQSRSDSGSWPIASRSPAVHPAREHRAGAAHDDAAHGDVRGGRPQRLAEGEDELGVERVALLGTVEDDVPDGAVVLLHDEAHGVQDRSGAPRASREAISPRTVGSRR